MNHYPNRGIWKFDRDGDGTDLVCVMADPSGRSPEKLIVSRIETRVAQGGRCKCGGQLRVAHGLVVCHKCTAGAN